MAQLKVKDLMSTSLVTVDARDTVGSAQERMRQAGIHHLPVVRSGQLVGLITHHDLMHSCLQHIERMEGGEECSFQRVVEVGEVMVTDVQTVSPDESAARAGCMLRELGIGCLPVTDAGRPVGMLTRADFLDVAIAALERDATRTDRPATPPPV
ncbi:MAG: CBS domain-containing protein [Myxococcota bacterium]